jgi:hypothetical protein
MTRQRAPGPGPRTVALHRVNRTAAGLIAVALALVVAACGTSNVGSASPAGPAGASAGSGASAGPSLSPAASLVAGAPSCPVLGPAAPTVSPAPGASQGPTPSPPHWPGTTVLAVIALGAADGEIQKAGDDLQAAANAQDLKAMWGAADGLAKMIDALMPNIDRLELYCGTQAAASVYRKAFPELSAGAKQLRDAITSGNANGIVAGSQAIAQGLEDYGPVRIVIGGLVEQAIVQQRLLVE